MSRREVWRTLHVGDRVRLVEYPTEFLQPGYVIFPETVRVYKRLVARGWPRLVVLNNLGGARSILQFSAGFNPLNLHAYVTVVMMQTCRTPFPISSTLDELCADRRGGAGQSQYERGTRNDDAVEP